MVADNHGLVLATASTPASMLADPRYGALPDAEKVWLEARIALFQRLDAAANKREAFAREAAGIHAGERWSASTIRKAYYSWVESGRDWYAARNRARLPDQAQRLPAETVQYWAELCYEFGGERRHRAAWRELVRRWHRGESIPGFARAEWGHDLPRGLSYENLMRKPYRPTPLADRVAAIGRGAAADLLPGVLTTRVGLPFGSRWVFDDIWHDHDVVVPGQLGLRRLLQFHCIELLSACQAARGMKAEVPNAQTGRRERLKERELLFLLAHVLFQFGYNAEVGCMLMMEHGTTNVDERVERILHDATGGKLRVARGAIESSPLAPGLYAGRGRGNFKFKAALESLGNLVHNELSSRLALPAQTGSNSRLNEPEALFAIERHADALAVAMAAVPQQLREYILHPATPVWRGIEFANLVQERINERTEHDLEGWEACGFVTAEYRTHHLHPWSPMAQLAEVAPVLRAAIEEALRADPRLVRARKLSPREVFNANRPQLTRLPAHLVPVLVGMEHAQERAIGRDGRMHFEDMELGPGEHHYDGLCYRADGEPVRLPAGERYATFCSSVDPDRMHLCDARGAYVGWIQRTFVPSKADAEGFARAAGEKLRAHRELMQPVLAAARPIFARQVEDAAMNNAILAQAQGAPTAPTPRAPAAGSAKADRASRRAAQLAGAAAQQLSTDHP